MNLSKQTKRREKKRMMSMLLAMLMLFSGIFGMLPGSGAMKAYAADVSENEVSENAVSENDSSEGYVIMELDDDLEEVVAVTEPEDVHYEGEGFRVDFVVQSSWENHYNAVITVTNTSDETLHNRGLSFVMMLPEGRYQLRIEKDGYFVRTLYCEVVSGEANFLGVIAMQKENEVLCTINISLELISEEAE